ncbi:hypothetical protein AVEN_126300-1 [Araneus ventricosus]|uniref:RNase H type-1 domain-containing protein n=1 Tax=Araneus ventricosus TaxID=182803 RepID=A0A4Y2I3G9_ARAVE|nr:hypothetical protein AVEN_126300-1 [Araneus ventricosus]
MTRKTPELTPSKSSSFRISPAGGKFDQRHQLYRSTVLHSRRISVESGLEPGTLLPPRPLKTRTKHHSKVTKHFQPKRISLEDGEANIDQKDIINIFTDGSKTEHGVGAAFFVLTNDIWAYQWSAKLNDNNTVFQAELIALHEAMKYASYLPNHNTFKIYVDNRTSITASSNSKSANQTAKKIQNPPNKSKNPSLVG